MGNIKAERVRRWMFAGAGTGLIYSTLYIVRPICEFFKRSSEFSFIVNGGIVVCILGVIGMVIRKKYLRRASTWFLLSLVMAGYFWGMALLSIPEERLHLIEYGILAFLFYRAFMLDLPGGRAYFAAFILTTLIGWGDEGIQHLLPNRYYQFQDVCLNSVSAILGLAFVYVVSRDVKPDANQ